MRIGSVAFAVLFAAQVALADGMFMAPEEEYGRLYGDLGAASTEQKGIIIEPAEGREVLLLQTTYHGPASGFAWVIPVPGEPLENDVFMASPDFISHVFDTTEPIVSTHIDLPRPKSATDDVGMMAPPADEAAAEGAEIVTLHRRMDVGDYDVSVLSASGPNVLIDWLNENGYATPDEHASVFDHYVGKGWYFVALRVLPDVVEEKPVLNDVKPIGISFWCDELVYPLHISRASSREKTALTLVTLTREPVECEQLERAPLPLGDHGMGTSYARIRRETIEAQTGPSAIVEFAGYEGTWGGPTWREELQGELGPLDLRNLWATRLWTILDRDEMEDLSFATADVRGERVIIERTGRMPGPPLWERVHVPAWLAGGMLFLLLGLLRVGARRVPSPLLYAAMIVGAAAIMLPALPRALQPWVIVISLLAGFITVPIVIGSEKREREAGGPRTGAELSTWILVTMGWVAAALAHTRSTYPLSLPDATVLPLFLVLAGVMWGAFAGASMLRDRSTVRRAVIAAIVVGGLLVYQTVSGRPRLPRSFGDIAPNALLVGGLSVVVLLLVAYGGLAVMRRGGGVRRREHLAILLTALAVAGLLTWASGGYLIDMSWVGGSGDMLFDRIPLILMLSLVFGYAWAALPVDDRLGDAARAFALTLLLLGAGLSLGQTALYRTAHAGSVTVRHSGLDELDHALTQLDDAILAFLEDAGCYPASLEDMTETVPPETGLDSSGNAVPMGGDWMGSRIKELPTDPLTGRNDTWVYEVTGSPMIDSGGLKIEVSVRETTGRRR